MRVLMERIKVTEMKFELMCEKKGRKGGKEREREEGRKGEDTVKGKREARERKTMTERVQYVL